LLITACTQYPALSSANLVEMCFDSGVVLTNPSASALLGSDFLFCEDLMPILYAARGYINKSSHLKKQLR